MAQNKPKKRTVKPKQKSPLPERLENAYSTKTAGAVLQARRKTIKPHDGTQ